MPVTTALQETETSSLLPSSHSYLHPTALPSNTNLTTIQAAAWHVENALLGLPPDSAISNPSGLCYTQANRFAYLKFQTSQNPEREICLAVLVLVTALEAPLWCLRGSPSLSLLSSPECTAPGHSSSQIYLSQLPYLPPLASVAVELICYAFLLHLVSLNVKASFSISRFISRPLPFSRACLTVLAVLDTLYFLVCLLWAPQQPPSFRLSFRLAPYIRVLLLSYTPAVYKIVTQCVSIIPSFLNVLSLLLLTVCFFGWIMAMFLDDLVETTIPRCDTGDGTDDVQSCAKVGDKFGSLLTSIYSLTILASSQDLPDITIPSYSHSRIYGIAWFLFYMIVNLLFANLVLGVVYQKYTERLKEDVLTFFDRRARGMREAYRVLTRETRDGEGKVAYEKGVTKEQLEDLVMEVNRSEIIDDTPKSHVDYLFQGIDSDHSGHVDFKEFLNICFALQEKFVRVRTESFVQREYTEFWRAYRLDRVKAWAEDKVGYTSLHFIVRCILMVNAASIFLESYQDLQHDEEQKDSLILSQNAWGWINMGFSFVYVAELGVKVTCIPWGRYWLYTTNRFDFIMTLVLVNISILWALPQVYISNETLRFFAILRLLRMLDLVAKLPRYEFFMECIVFLARGSKDVMLVLFISSSLWTTFGTQIYGGAIYAENEALKDSDMFKTNFDVYNFNDYVMGLGTFTTILVAGGPQTALTDAFGLVSSHKTSVVFFFSFYYLNVMVFMNVFVSFVVDAFLSQYSVREAKLQEEVEEKLERESSSSFGNGARRAGRSRSVVGKDLDEEHVEAGWEVIKFDSKSNDALFVSMFEDDLADIIDGVEQNT
jgi:hypothetical protein